MERIQKEKIKRINNATTRIKTLRVNIDRCQETLQNLNKSGFTQEFIENSKNKNKESITRCEEEIEENEQLIRDINQGLYDEEIEEEIEKGINVQNLLLNQQKVNKELREQKFQEKQANIQKKRKEDNHSLYDKENDANREYKRYLKACDRLPDYIQKNLKTMPGNKGYIFMDVSFYGDLPKEEGQPYVLFEKMRDGSMKIFEYFPNWTRISLKDKNGNKIILTDEPHISLMINKNINIKGMKEEEKKDDKITSYPDNKKNNKDYQNKNYKKDYKDQNKNYNKDNQSTSSQNYHKNHNRDNNQSYQNKNFNKDQKKDYQKNINKDNQSSSSQNFNKFKNDKPNSTPRNNQFQNNTPKNENYKKKKDYPKKEEEKK